MLYKQIRQTNFRKDLLFRQQEEDDEMRFKKRSQTYKYNSSFQPVIPLVPVKLPANQEIDKTKYITFELKVRTGTGAGAPSYKKTMRTFDEGTPQDWMDVLTGIREIWKQNSVNAPTDRAATIMANLKGDSLSAFATALEDARVYPDQDDEEDPTPLVMTQNHIDLALRAVTTIVFRFRALETQKQWMNRAFKKPYDLSSRMTATALSRINNYLPYFLEGNASSKYSESELVGLLEWLLPNKWRKVLDRKSFVPVMHDLKDLIDECECIERNEVPFNRDEDDDSDNNKNTKKVKFAKTKTTTKKRTRAK